MRTYDNGCFYTVQVSRREVLAFLDRWPGAGLPCRAISFQFDKRSGDLVDVCPDTVDGPAAVALSQDAQTYGRKRLGIPE
jgi:hypothetical protein